MQRQAKALGDASRFRIFRHMTDVGRPVPVAELTELLGFNHNAIRQHLAVLHHAGLITESAERRPTRGRPRKEYIVRRDALDAFRATTGSYQFLAQLLLRLTTSDANPYEVGFQAGAQPDTGHVEPHEGTEVAVSLALRLAADGFEPTVESKTELTLAHCPYAALADESPSIVCEIHRGLIDGHLSTYDSNLSGTLLPEDPRTAGCKVTVNEIPETT